MKKIFLILPILFACKSYQNKDYYVERYPDFWEDTIVLENGHWHFCDNNNIRFFKPSNLSVEDNIRFTQASIVVPAVQSEWQCTN